MLFLFLPFSPVWLMWRPAETAGHLLDSCVWWCLLLCFCSQDSQFCLSCVAVTAAESPFTVLDVSISFQTRCRVSCVCVLVAYKVRVNDAGWWNSFCAHVLWDGARGTQIHRLLQKNSAGQPSALKIKWKLAARLRLSGQGWCREGESRPSVKSSLFWLQAKLFSPLWLTTGL